METEIELKFFVSPEFSETLLSKIAETKVLQHSCRELGNTYFDTPDNCCANTILVSEFVALTMFLYRL
ncbi:adenylate cyclase [Vibrio maritimus]|uniref:Adenylate cyclase n=2 Tax=Vibrio TaxID=662 RepID=A0A090S1G4_9VIBR|nr:adenylate cyclase [Vibrio maritimus]GAL23975.1 adenylate cyclase [Vibrio variabilis]